MTRVAVLAACTPFQWYAGALTAPAFCFGALNARPKRCPLLTHACSTHFGVPATTASSWLMQQVSRLQGAAHSSLLQMWRWAMLAQHVSSVRPPLPTPLVLQLVNGQTLGRGD